MVIARQEPADPRGEERPDAHAQQVLQRRGRGDAVPFADVADEEDLAGRGRRREGSEDRELAQPPRRHDERRRARRTPPPPTTGSLVRRQRSHRNASPSAASTSSPSFRDSVARPARRPAAAKAPRRALQPAGTHPEGRQDERLIEGEVVRLDHVHDRHDGDRDEDAGTERDHARRAGIAGHRPGEGCGQGAEQGERQRRCPSRRTEHGDERDLDQRRQWHPMGVRGDRQGRVGRDRSADLGEDPDQVDRESTTVGEVPGDVHVVERIGIRRVGEVPDEHDPRRPGQARIGRTGYARPVQRSTGSWSFRPVRTGYRETPG